MILSEAPRPPQSALRPYFSLPSIHVGMNGMNLPAEQGWVKTWVNTLASGGRTRMRAAHVGSAHVMMRAEMQ